MPRNLVGLYYYLVDAVCTLIHILPSTRERIVI